MAASKEQKTPILGIIVFVLYLLLLLYYLFFAEGLGRTTTDEYRYNLILLKEIRRYYEHRQTIGLRLFLLNVVGNIVAFMPFGFFLPMILKRFRNVFAVTIFGFIFSLFVECIQLCFRLGSFDVDDLLLNTIGAFLGVTLYWIGYGIKYVIKKA